MRKGKLRRATFSEGALHLADTKIGRTSPHEAPPENERATG